MATLPIQSVIYPKALQGQTNGEIDPALMGNSGTRGMLLLQVAIPAWQALVASAAQAGHVLDATGMYRSYDQQVALFTSRYVTPPVAGATEIKKWNGQSWSKKPGVASAAVPGTSNHGWGLAIDTAEQSDSDPEAESIDQPTLDWMVGNAARFGFSWELQSEPWHIRYVAGDNIPQAVIEWMAGQLPPIPPQPDPPPAEEVVLKDMPTLHKGDTGNAVVVLQGMLIQRGVWTDKPANRDGIFGDGTEKGVKTFQRQRGLVEDGVPGPKTWAALGHA